MENTDYILVQEELRDLEREIDTDLDRLSLAITTAEQDIDVSNESINIISDYIDYDIANEADDIGEFKDRVGRLYTELSGFIFKRFKKFSPLVDRSSDFKSKELEKLINEINSGVLVPDETINENAAERFNNKLAVFYASGYGLTSGCSDLITYIENISYLPNKSGKYMNGLDLMYKSLNSPEQTLNVPRLNGLLNVKKTLNGISETVVRKYKITDFRLSIVNKWFSSQVELAIVSNSTKRGIRVHVDTFSVNTKNKRIGLPNNSQTIKLLETGLRLKNNLKNAHKSISFNLKKMTRDNTIQLVKSAGGSDNTHRFLIAKFTEAVTKANINMYKDLVSADAIIIAYVKLTYRKA
jgi:hypothetical protein